MKKLIALVLAVVCVLALAGCNDTAEIQIDKIVMTHSTDGDKSSEKVTITDKETISELLAMHNSLQTEEKNRPIADERFWVIFYMGDNVEIEWCISAYGNDLDNAEFISCSTLWSAGNHKIKSNFDYNRVVEIFNSNCYFDSGSDLSNEDTAGTIKFYSETTKEFTEPVSTTSIELSKEQEKEIKRILKNVKEWTDDHSVNRLAYYFDGEFTLSDSEFVYYFTYEYNVIYYDHYYAEIGTEEMEYIKSIGVTE